MDSPILSSAQMRDAEEAAFARGVEVEALMDQAGAGIARAVRKFFPQPGKCIVFAGKGHNAGDALVAAECLRERGWKIDIRLAFPEDDCSELTRKKLQELRDAPDPVAAALWAARGADVASASASRVAQRNGYTIILDGLLGTGAKSLLREPIRAAAREINRLRREQRSEERRVGKECH